MNGCGDSIGTGGYGPTERYCHKLQECDLPGGTPSFVCRLVFKRLEMYVLQPAAVSQCIGRASCEQIQDESFVEQCLDYDPASFSCNGTVLHFCNTAHVCKNLNCDQACRQYVPATKSATCGYDSQAKNVRCLCTT